MGKLSFSDGLALFGISLGIVLLVLDKAGKNERRDFTRRIGNICFADIAARLRKFLGYWFIRNAEIESWDAHYLFCWNGLFVARYLGIN